MRKIVPALSLLLAACASETPAPVSAPAPVAADHRHGHLDRMSASDLGELFGVPALQVREGPGVKLQWRGGGCVLDTYLYPPVSGSGVERVTHVDARLTSGAPTDPATCESNIESSR